MLPASPKTRLIAFYLPQFHPIPENDEWWGKGFTEWTNVTRAKPLFAGHHQPHLPADLGFYDLRLPETRQAQADLAREYGIHGFCYYHYWFNGKRLLERPFAEVLASGKPDFPFCLCWANENWTRRWDGGEQQILLAQKYTEEDDRQHIRYLATVFRDNRYIRVAEKPLFLVYRAGELPDIRKATSIWREEARRMGVGELFLCRVESFANERDDPTVQGFDAGVEFQPDWMNLGPAVSYGGATVHDYSMLVERNLDRPRVSHRRFPCVTPSWDNSPRRKTDAIVVVGSSPDLYEKWLTAVLRRQQPVSPDENIVFVNAWNEWAEGNHLEPCQRWGRGYLEATRRAIRDVRESMPPLPTAPVELGTTDPKMLVQAGIGVVGSLTSASLSHLQAEIASAAERLGEASAQLQYWEVQDVTTHEIKMTVPPGDIFILVDEECFEREWIFGGRALPFLERDGQYWGAPENDGQAVAELDRLRQSGARFIVFVKPAFWWLEHYAGLRQHLRSNFPCLLENERLVVFDLRATTCLPSFSTVAGRTGEVGLPAPCSGRAVGAAGDVTRTDREGEVQ
jgi:hypothetical protein